LCDRRSGLGGSSNSVPFAYKNSHLPNQTMFNMQSLIHFERLSNPRFIWTPHTLNNHKDFDKKATTYLLIKSAEFLKPLGSDRDLFDLSRIRVGSIPISVAQLTVIKERS
jgi:hypothetical protein